MPDDKIPPNAEGYAYRVTGWLKEGIEEADSFLRAQKGYNQIDDAIAFIMSDEPGLRSSFLSSTRCNQTSKAFFDMTAGMTDIKPFWEYRTYNKRFEKTTSIYGKLSTNCWIQRQMDFQFMYAVQYALSGGTSYFEPTWDTETEDLRAEAWDPRDVLPIRPTASPSIQDCYGVITRKARTVNHIRYLCRHVFNRPDLIDQIRPDRDGSMVTFSLRNTRVGQLLDKMGSPFRQRLFGEKAQREIPRVPTADIFTAYIDDDSINESSKPVYMGSWEDQAGEKVALNNWSYVVQPGERLYPRKRQIVYTSGLPREPLYDGPSPWWHGLFPYPKLTLDPVPWSYLGKAPVWDLLPLNQSLNRLLRVYDDWTEKLARPDARADKNSVSRSMFERLDTRRAGLKLLQNPIAGKGIEILPPPPLPPDFWRGIEYYEAKIKELSGTQDLSNLMRMGQVPSDDTVEKILEGMSLSWRMRSRVIEVFVREFALMMAYNFAQFYTLQRRLTILGSDGVTLEDFDFDPGSMIPDFVHSDDFAEEGVVKATSLSRGPLPRYDRTREFLRQFTFHIAPSSLLAASEIQRKLLYLQLSRAGLIDRWTLLEVLGIPNVGNPPSGADNITSRLMAEAEMGLGMNNSPTGRKASGQSMPRLTVKES